MLPSPNEYSIVRPPSQAAQTVRDAEEVPLTEREREVVVLIGLGHTNEQIAAELHVVKGTVATHIQHLLTKLNCTSRVQLATWAAARGLLDHPHQSRDRTQHERDGLTTHESSSRINAGHPHRGPGDGDPGPETPANLHIYRCLNGTQPVTVRSKSSPFGCARIKFASNARN